MKTKLLFFLIFIINLSSLWAQTVVIDNTATGASIPTEWSSVNAVTAQPIQKDGYYLLEYGANKDYLYSAVYDLSSYESVEVSFFYGNFGNGSDTKVRVELSIDGGLNYDYTQITPLTANTTNLTGRQATLVFDNVSFPGLVLSDNIRIRFSDNDSGKHVRLGKIVIKALLPSCTPPTLSGGLTSVDNCGDSVISFNNVDSVPTGELYWQTTAAGMLTSLPFTGDRTVATSGTYYLRRFAGNCWSSALSVVANPTPLISITTQPQNVSITVGSTATFSVVSSYTTGVNYQWQTLQNGTWVTAPGTNNQANYNFTNAQIADSGKQFRVLVSNVCGNVTSSVAQLVVASGPCASIDFEDNNLGSWTGNGITFGGQNCEGGRGMVFNASGDNIVSPGLINPSQIKFFKKRSTNIASWQMDIEIGTSVNGPFTLIQSISNITNTCEQEDITIPPALVPSGTVFIRFIDRRPTGGHERTIDNIEIFCAPISGPVISVFGNGNFISNGSTAVVSTNSTLFPTLDLGQNAQVTFTVYNTGVEDLDITAPIALLNANGFTVTQPTATVIAPSSSATFTVSFSATSYGTFINTVSIPTNDTANNPYAFMIKATVIDPNAVNTIYKPGELVFVGFDAQVNGSGTTDGYLIATLVDMKPGTSFSLVNSRYEAGAAAGVRTDKWGGSGNSASAAPGVATITYNGTTVIPAGSVLEFKTEGFGANIINEVNVAINNVISDYTSSFSSVLLNFDDVPNLSSSGADQIYLVQGEFVFDGVQDENQANYFLNGNLLHGLTYRSDWVDLYDTCSGANGDRVSRLPEVLKCFNVRHVSSNASTGYYKNTANHGLATLREIILSIGNNVDNWFLGTGRYSFDSSSIQANKAGRCFNIDLNYLPQSGKWLGGVIGSEDDWFNCGNWDDMRVPRQTTDVYIGAQTHNPVIYHTNQDYPTGALANNLMIVDGASLSMPTSTSILNLSGNWTNESTTDGFNQLQGTVILNGSNPQIITAQINNGVERFNNLELKNDLTTEVSGQFETDGNLIVHPNKTLTISTNNYVLVSNAITNNGVLKVDDKGQLVQVNNNAVNTGNIILDRKTSYKKWDYSHYATPVQTANTYALSPNTLPNRIYEWVPTVNSANGTYGNWINPLGAMTIGKGYAITAPNNFSATTAQEFIATFTGVPNNGIVSLPMQRGDFDGADYLNTLNNIYVSKWDDNYNLIGNPYPSAISANEFLIHNNGVIQGHLDLWINSGLSSLNADPFYGNYDLNYDGNSFLIYNLSGSTAGPGTFNGSIGAAQGFFVTMLDEVPSGTTVEFTNQMRSKNHNNSVFYRTANQPESRLWIDLAKVDSNTNQFINRILVGYVNNATNGLDNLNDAVKAKKLDTDIYSLTTSSVDGFSIQGRQLPFNPEDIVPLGINIKQAGNYVINLAFVEGELENETQEIYIEDRELQITHNLKSGNYNFSSTAGRFEDRFVIKYVNSRLSLPDTELINDVLVFGNNTLTVQASTQNIKSVAVYDVLGRLVDKVTKTDRQILLSNVQKNNAGLILYIELENGQLITKKYIY